MVGENGEVALLEFDHRVQTLLPFTSEPDQVPHRVSETDRGQPDRSGERRSNAGREHAEYASARTEANHSADRETRDYGSSIHLRDVLTKAEFANVTIFSVNISHM